MKTLSAREKALIYNALLEKAVENRAAASRLDASKPDSGPARLAATLIEDADTCEELADEFI